MEARERARIGIIGAGALGSYFGIRLALAGNPVSFLLRSDYDAVSQSGFSLTMADGREMQLESPNLCRTVADMGQQDWVIIGLKTTRNYLFEELLPPVVGPQTLLITIQNGLGNVEALEALFPGNPVIGALCQIGVNREGPGRIRNFIPSDGFVQIGGGRWATDAQLDCVQATFESAGIHTKRTASLGEALWRKLMWNVPFNGLTVIIGGKGTDAVCSDPQLRSRARALMEEIRTAATALGYAIEPEYTDKLLAFTDQFGDYKSSSVLDWRAGRRLEVDAIFRKPLEAGQAAAVAMPELEILVEELDAGNS
jgi:2-dehydropantoate 2-reductase